MKLVFRNCFVASRYAAVVFATITLIANSLATYAAADEITVFDHLPVGRGDTPVPTDKDLLFYIQRSLNPNTVVYVAKRKPTGEFVAKKPIDVFWRRFASDGKRSKLTYIERTMAFGVVSKSSNRSEEAFRANLVSYPAKKGILKLDGANKPVIETMLGKHKVRLIYAYIQLKGNDVIPKIVYVDVIGQDVQSGKYIRRRVYSPKNNRPEKFLN